MRLIRMLASYGIEGLQRPVEIRDTAGRFVARVDVADVERRVIFEYYGEEFHGPRRRKLDARRQRRVEALGWTVVVVTKADLRRRARGLRQKLARLATAA
ncbi:MAG: hypothetical protein ACRDY7_11970 [Acidimicrobiia bacterium]